MYGISLLINIFPISPLIANGSIISYVVDRNDNPVLVGVPNRLVLIGILIGNLVGSTKLYVLRPILYAVGVDDDEDVVVVDEVDVEVDDVVAVDVVLVVAVVVVLVVAVEVVAVVAVVADVIGIPAMADAIA